MKLRIINQRMAAILMVSASLFLSGCLKTWSDVSDQEEKKIGPNQVQTLQKQKADQEAQYQSYEGQLRAMNGRIETLEHQNEVLSREKEDNRQLIGALESRIKALEEGILQLDQKTEAMRKAPPAASIESDKKSVYDEGDEYFGRKEWKKAITSFQKYRETNPKGEHFADATYKMGVAFQELKMNKEAKVFFDDVIERFPKSKSARSATYRLNQIKKR